MTGLNNRARFFNDVLLWGTFDKLHRATVMQYIKNNFHKIDNKFYKIILDCFLFKFNSFSSNNRKQFLVIQTNVEVCIPYYLSNYRCVIVFHYELSKIYI